MFNLFKMFFGKTFSLSIDGDGNMGGGGGNEGEGSPSSGVKPDVKPETHFADEQGVPYYNRVQELNRKLEGYKDVDLELYGRVKDLDFEEVEHALQFRSQIYGDPEKLTKVLDILKGKAAETVDPTKTKAQQNPETKALLDRIEKTEKELQRFQQMEQRREQGNWMKQYDSSVQRSIEESLKSPDFKDLGGKLTEFEKTAVSKMMDDIYQADAALAHKGLQPKLSLENIPETLQGVMKMVLDSRRGTLGGMVKKDDSPEAMKGNGNAGQPKPKPQSEEQRIEAMQGYMKERQSQNLPTV